MITSSGGGTGEHSWAMVALWCSWCRWGGGAKEQCVSLQRWPRRPGSGPMLLLSGRLLSQLSPLSCYPRFRVTTCYCWILTPPFPPTQPAALNKIRDSSSASVIICTARVLFIHPPAGCTVQQSLVCLLMICLWCVQACCILCCVLSHFSSWHKTSPATVTAGARVASSQCPSPSFDQYSPSPAPGARCCQ